MEIGDRVQIREYTTPLLGGCRGTIVGSCSKGWRIALDQPNPDGQIDPICFHNDCLQAVSIEDQIAELESKLAKLREEITKTDVWVGHDTLLVELYLVYDCLGS